MLQLLSAVLSRRDRGDRRPPCVCASTQMTIRIKEGDATAQSLGERQCCSDETNGVVPSPDKQLHAATTLAHHGGAKDRRLMKEKRREKKKKESLPVSGSRAVGRGSPWDARVTVQTVAHNRGAWLSSSRRATLPSLSLLAAAAAAAGACVSVQCI